MNGYDSQISIYVLLYVLATTVMFNQSMYNVEEDDGPAQLILVLSNPSSSDITVQVITEDGSATGKYCN